MTTEYCYNFRLGPDLRYYQKYLFKVKNKAQMYEIIYLEKKEEQNPNLEFDSFFQIYP